MSLMDDVFDIRDKLKGTDLEEAFDRIETRLWAYEEAYDLLCKLYNKVDGIKDTLKELENKLAIKCKSCEAECSWLEVNNEGICKTCIQKGFDHDG